MALVGQPYFLYENSTDEIIPVALIDLCNDAVRKESSKRQPGYKDVIDIHETKQFPFLPAVKITRIGVAKQFQRHNFGSHLLNMVKRLFLTENRTGCRFITVMPTITLMSLSFTQKMTLNSFTTKTRITRPGRCSLI